MIEIDETDLPGAFLIRSFVAEDSRGVFCKTFHEQAFRDYGLATKFPESYYSVSDREVIRGMHFQLPPQAHNKLVFVPKGRILDVVLDLRRDLPTYGKTFSVELSEKNRLSIYIPKGCAHGFKSLEDNSITVYNVTTVYDSESDTGLRWDSFGFDWKCQTPCLSSRDQSLLKFGEFSPPNNWNLVK